MTRVQKNKKQYVNKAINEKNEINTEDKDQNTRIKPTRNKSGQRQDQ